MSIRTLALLLGISGLALAGGASALIQKSALADEAHTSRYGNGQAKERTHFVDGLRHGLTTRWYADGTLRAEGQFESGKMVGEWVWNTPEGTLDPQRSGFYKSGLRVSL